MIKMIKASFNKNRVLEKCSDYIFGSISKHNMKIMIFNVKLENYLNNNISASDECSGWLETGQ